MARILYELKGKDDRRFSPYCWRSRFALAHKGLEVEYAPVRFCDKDKIGFSGQTLVPVLVDGDNTVFDSWAIARYLEQHYGEAPTLFGGAIGEAEALFVNGWADRILHPVLVKTIVTDILAHVEPEDRRYFRDSRQKRFGVTLETLVEDRDQRAAHFRALLEPARAALAAQPFLCGDAPAYADYILAGTLQFCRLTSPYPLLEKDDIIYAWRERMLDLFDGLARRAVGAHD